MDNRNKKAKSKRGKATYRGRGRGGTSSTSETSLSPASANQLTPEASGTVQEGELSKEAQTETAVPKTEHTDVKASIVTPTVKSTASKLGEEIPSKSKESNEEAVNPPSEKTIIAEMKATDESQHAKAHSPELTKPSTKEVLLDVPPTSSDIDPRQGSPNPPSESGSGVGRRRRLSSIKIDDRVRKISIGIGGVPKRGYWAGLESDSDSEDSLLAQSTKKRPSIFTLGPTLMGYNKRQWNILIIFALVDFLSSVLISIQPILYPREAKKLTVTPTEYGILFGVFEIVILALSPAFFNLLKKVNSKVMLISGILINGLCAILFSFLVEVPTKPEFLAFSFILRIIEAAGDAACITSAYAIIQVEFPDSVATTFASLEAFLGLGFILGPLLAGALYELDGFMVPFMTFGILLICSGILAMIILPKQFGVARGDSVVGNDDKTSRFLPGFLTLLQIPTVALSSFGIFGAAISLGYLNCTLFAHIERFNLSALTIGGIFIINQGMYSVSAPVWNFLVNRTPDPKYIMLLGSILIFGSFLIVGPAPFIPLDTQLEITCAGLFIHGLGIGAMFVSGFVLIMRDTIFNGYLDNESTYGYVSGLYTSVFTFGSFIGLTASGILYDYVGFEWGSTFILGAHILIAFFLVVFLLVGSRIPRSRYSTGEDDESQPLLLNPDNSGIDGTENVPGSQLQTPSIGIQASSSTYGSLEIPKVSM